MQEEMRLYADSLRQKGYPPLMMRVGINTGEVELTEEREHHIAEHHPGLLPEHREWIAETLTDRDQVRRSVRFGNARIFARWCESIRGSKHVVVLMSATTPSDRHWIVTAYLARKLVEGGVEWQRS
jgi:hypothetical protein